MQWKQPCSEKAHEAPLVVLLFSEHHPRLSLKNPIRCIDNITYLHMWQDGRIYQILCTAQAVNIIFLLDAQFRC